MIELDLHTHTHHSFDSIIRPQEFLQTARQRGLDGVAVTDHGTIRGGLEVQTANKDPEFLIIVGAEIHTELGDILGLFLNAEIKSRSSSDVVEEIHRQGGVAILPHPYKGHDPYNFDGLYVDGVEAFNARCTKAQNAAALLLARHRQLPAVGGSDAHWLQEVGRATTCFDLSLSQLRQIGPLELLEHVVPSPAPIVHTPSYVQYSSQVIKHYKQRRAAALGASLLMVVLTWLRNTRVRR